MGNSSYRTVSGPVPDHRPTHLTHPRPLTHCNAAQATASMAKYWGTDLQVQVADDCVQLHGGWGYMWEYPVCRALADGRVQKIYGGTNEIMKELIARECAK